MKDIKVWKIILIWVLSPILVVIMAGVFSRIFNLEVSDLTLDALVSLGILLMILKAGKVNILLIKERFKDFKNKFNIKEILSVVLTQVFLSMGLSLLCLGFIAIVDLEQAISLSNSEIGNPSNLIDLILLSISTIILAPIIEEIVYRKVLFIKFSKKLGIFVAAIVSSLVFGIGHDTLGILGAMVFGLACCILYKKYENILVPMSVHFINNFIAGIFTCIDYFRGEFNTPTDVITNSDISTYLIVGSLLTVISLIVFIRFIVKNKNFILIKRNIVT